MYRLCSYFVLVLVLVLSLGGCGRKGPVRPLKGELPQHNSVIRAQQQQQQPCCTETAAPKEQANQSMQ